jgi:hypothetical protein
LIAEGGEGELGKRRQRKEMRRRESCTCMVFNRQPEMGMGFDLDLRRRYVTVGLALSIPRDLQRPGKRNKREKKIFSHVLHYIMI